VFAASAELRCGARSALSAAATLTPPSRLRATVTAVTRVLVFMFLFSF
jgi:hypothetical protein